MLGVVASATRLCSVDRLAGGSPGRPLEASEDREGGAAWQHDSSDPPFYRCSGQDLRGVCGRKGYTTTGRGRDRHGTPDLEERDFSARAPDPLWRADITYVPTDTWTPST
jgi:hypothetical protein